jgi:hypothetical protein
MNAQIIKDRAGTPVSVVVAYRDWLDIEQKLKLSDGKQDTAENPLDWYTLTETSSAILNELIAYTGREEYKEMKNPVPDRKRLSRLQTIFEEINAINREPMNFKSISRMKEIIRTYAPKLCAVNEGYDEIYL